MLRFGAGCLLSLALLAGCTSTSVVPLAQNKVIINTSAAPVCGGTGAQGVAVKMAAVETLRRGYSRFYIVAADSANNVDVYQTGPTYATTNSTYQGYGNTVYGQSNTTFGGRNTIITGSHDASLGVVMLRAGDAGYQNAVDAKAALGEKWHEIAERGVSTCG
ncbi:MAG: hypothetical protein Q8K33_01695 [Cypionkella sp.]|uniref:hypothetical protein n=1 Tax=Cypionkella sp. TaxID=2811411 RepID=UPI002730D2B4|nr:hypothetical protein [Cypionkella sp.]MDP2047595.1 hypothetical protein [Cypionkella sp.]